MRFEISPRAFRAVIFDLDGVVTRTAKVHAAAWKRLFDDYLRDHSDRLGEPFRPFDIQADYRAYVDGKPRYDGVRSFLESRGIQLRFGTTSDSPNMKRSAASATGRTASSSTNWRLTASRCSTRLWR